MTDIQEQIIAALKSQPAGMTMKQLVAALGYSNSTLHRHMADLQEVHIARYARDNQMGKTAAVFVYGREKDKARPAKRLEMKRSIGIDSSAAAAVNRRLQWLAVETHKPPMGVKLLLINRSLGVATLGSYSPNQNWTHWQGMPVFSDKEEA